MLETLAKKDFNLQIQNDFQPILIFKGQLISKYLFGIFNSPKKRMKKFNFTTMIPQVDLFSFVFLEEIEDTKKTFRNYLTFS